VDLAGPGRRGAGPVSGQRIGVVAVEGERGALHYAYALAKAGAMAP